MKTEKVSFLNQQGHTLAARLEFPDSGIPKSYALFAHCFTCNKNLTAVRNIGQALTEKGIAVLRFDFTGLGESEGHFENTNFSSNVEDLVAAAEFLKSKHEAPEILIGHSLGGAAVLFAANQIAAVKAVVTLGAPSNPQHVSHLIQSGIKEIEHEGEAIVDIGGRSFTVKKHFLDDIKEKNIESELIKMKKALLVMHSPQDNTVSIENAAEIYKMAKHPKSFISLDGADHLLSKREDSLFTGAMIAQWVERYIQG